MSKNAPILASCSFDKHGLIWIIFDKQYQHTFGNDMHVQLSLSLHFYLLYLRLNSGDGNGAFWRRSMLVKQSSFFSRKHRTLSLQICVRQTVRMTTEFGDWRRNVCTLYKMCLRYQPLWPAIKQRFIDTWMGKHITRRRRWSSWSMEKAVTCKHVGKKTSRWTSAKLKPALFRANSLPRKTRS